MMLRTILHNDTVGLIEALGLTFAKDKIVWFDTTYQTLSDISLNK